LLQLKHSISGFWAEPRSPINGKQDG